MFKGEYNHSIDDKGRVILPAKLREELGDRVVISRGFDTCLYVYTTEEWDKFAKKLETLSVLELSSRKMRQFFMSWAVDCDLDKQGRIVIPQKHREKIFGGDKELTLVGDGDHIEIWTTSAWNEHISDINDDIESLAADLAELGIKL